MINRGQNFKQVALKMVGSSVFGRYPKVNVEHTYNLFESDGFMVPYSGYKIAIPGAGFHPNAKEGRGLYASSKFNCMFAVIDSSLYKITIFYDQTTQQSIDESVSFIGTLQSSTGVVYMADNNKPQLAISDGSAIYIYDPTHSPQFYSPSINFTPGYITFHDTYFICAATNDYTYSPPATNTWRLSDSNDGGTWPSGSSSVGLLETKPDATQGVVRFPSRGNMIFVMGKNVTEAWFDTGAQLFPYQRNNQFNIDYGCVSPATIAYMDQYVVWLAQNEKSGPIIVYSNGGEIQKVTTDGIDYLFSQLKAPADSSAFMYRQDGHLFYHINFYTDKLSLFYDFNTGKIYNASDQNLSYFIAGQVAFLNDQYWFVSKNTGNLYAFDTTYYTYQDTTPNGTVETYTVPRIRTCSNIRLPSQEYFIANDVGFTIESGETDYIVQTIGPINLITQSVELVTDQAGNFIILQQQAYEYTTPRVDLSISIDGGATFGSDFSYNLPPIGQRKNRLMWWQLGAANDLVCMFKFWSIGRTVFTDGIANIRQ